MVSMNLTSARTDSNTCTSGTLYMHMNTGQLYIVCFGGLKSFAQLMGVSMNYEHCCLLEFPTLLAQQQQPEVSARKSSPLLTCGDVN